MDPEGPPRTRKKRLNKRRHQWQKYREFLRSWAETSTEDDTSLAGFGPNTSKSDTKLIDFEPGLASGDASLYGPEISLPTSKTSIEAGIVSFEELAVYLLEKTDPTTLRSV